MISSKNGRAKNGRPRLRKRHLSPRPDPPDYESIDDRLPWDDVDNRVTDDAIPGPKHAATGGVNAESVPDDVDDEDDYTVKYIDEDDDEDEEPQPRRKPRVLSRLQSGLGRNSRHYRVPDWAMALTQDGAERAVLGVVDYRTGFDKEGRVRARGDILHKDQDGVAWYVVTARQLMTQIGANNVHQVRRALNRLVGREFLVRQIHTWSAKTAGLRLRIHWPHVEAVVKKAWGKGETSDD